MPHIKNALFRYRTIDRCIRNDAQPFPSKLELRRACEEALFGSEEGEHICDSTIEKDLFAMRMEMDAPIKYSKKHKGYYYEDATYSLSEIPLNQKDLESIKFATQTLMQFRDVDLFKQFGFAIDKLFDRVSTVNQKKDSKTEDYIQFEQSTSTKGNEYLNEILEAIPKKQIIQFSYESFQTGKKKTRRVLPLLLKEYRNRWYLISFDLIKESLSTYALERIDDFIVTPEFFFNEIKFSAQQFFKNAIGITANDSNPENVIIKADNIAAKYIESQPIHHSQEIIKRGKNKTQFSIEVIISEELIRTILSYGGEIEVVSPEILKNEIKNRIKNMIETYNI